MTDKTQTIRSLNDHFRQGDSSVPGQIVITHGLVDLLKETGTPPEDLMHLVRTFDSFTADNDPLQSMISARSNSKAIHVFGKSTTMILR